MENKFTTVQITKDTLNRLRKLAITDKRHTAAQIDWLVEQEEIRRQAEHRNGNQKREES